MNLFDIFRPSRSTKAASVRATDTPRSADIPENEPLWRKLGRKRHYDLPAIDHRKAQEDAIRNWRGSPLLKPYLDKKSAAVIGVQETQPQIESADTEALREAAQDALSEFWDRNRLAVRATEWAIHVSATGEGFMTLSVGMDAEGRGSRLTTVGWLDPLLVSAVATSPADPGTRIGAVVSRMTPALPLFFPFVGDDFEFVHREFRGIQKGQRVMVPGMGTSGEALACEMGVPTLYLPANVTPGQTRGLPDAYPVLDLLGAHMDWVWGATERGLNANALSWHVTVEGADEATLKAQQTNFRQIVESGSGGSLFTNEKIKAVALAPALSAIDYTAWEKTLVVRIANGLGVPEHWLSEASGQNQATASELSGPAIMALRMFQSAFCLFIEQACWFALAQIPELRAKLDADPDAFDVHVPRPDLTSKDALRAATVLNQRQAALSMARSEGTISNEEHQRLARTELLRHDFELRAEEAPDPDEFEKGAKGLDWPDGEGASGNLGGMPRTPAEEEKRAERTNRSAA